MCIWTYNRMNHKGEKDNFIIVFNEFNFVIFVWKVFVHFSSKIKFRFLFDFKLGIKVIFIVLINFMNKRKRWTENNDTNLIWLILTVYILYSNGSNGYFEFKENCLFSLLIINSFKKMTSPTICLNRIHFPSFS